MNNGGFVSVNQLSVVGDVKVYGTRYVIRGAIAKTETGKLLIVPEERMKKKHSSICGATVHTLNSRNWFHSIRRNGWGKLCQDQLLWEICVAGEVYNHNSCV